jgi:hypothetical protein
MRRVQAAQAAPASSADDCAALVRSLLPQGRFVEALFAAAREGLPLQINAICRRASAEDINAVSDGLTPLLLVCQLTGEKARGALTCAQVLVAKGARVDVLCGQSVSALSYAQRAGNAELCAFFSSKGASA